MSVKVFNLGKRHGLLGFYMKHRKNQYISRNDQRSYDDGYLLGGRIRHARIFSSKLESR